MSNDDTGEAGDEAIEVGELGRRQTANDWLARLLQIPIFALIPPLQLQTLFLRMQEIKAEPGEIVVREGEPGDYFYVIAAGRCAVSSSGARWLAELQPGDFFGEEALLAQSPRNATVTLLTRGRLMRLARQDFLEILQVPEERRLTLATARSMIAAGRAQWLDVRPSTPCDDAVDSGTVLIALDQLRIRINELDAGCAWICCCDDGRLSAVAFFLLSKHGLDAYLLDGGLHSKR